MKSQYVNHLPSLALVIWDHWKKYFAKYFSRFISCKEPYSRWFSFIREIKKGEKSECPCDACPIEFKNTTTCLSRGINKAMTCTILAHAIDPGHTSTRNGLLSTVYCASVNRSKDVRQRKNPLLGQKRSLSDYTDLSCAPKNSPSWPTASVAWGHQDGETNRHD